MAMFSLPRVAKKKPTYNRFFLLVLLLSMSAVTASAQQELSGNALTEAEVITRALARAPLHDMIEGAIHSEEGRGRTASAYPNPQIAYMREQTLGSLGTAEDYLTVSQTVDLGYRRGSYGDAAAIRARAARLDGEATRLEVVTVARSRFYEVLYRQMRVAAFDSWGSRMDRVLDVVTRRERRGDAATYDRRRIERERVFVGSRLEAEAATLARAQGFLRAITGTATPGRVSGVLLPNTEPTPANELEAQGRTRPDLLALELRARAAEVTRKAAARWWAPDLRVEGGWKGVEHAKNTRSDGFLLGAALSIPLWDRSTGLSLASSGEARNARGRHALMRAELEGELEGARTEALRLQRAATAFRENTARVSDELERIAAAGYEGGELGLLELLDAHRSAAEDSLMLLELEYAARRARIDLDRLAGNLPR
jgi:cobalt-zinc-cadmium efflux system outer membrane protein